jgi:hypothetical protein
LNGATRGQEACLRRLDIRNKEVKDRPVRLTLFHVKAKGPGLEANESLTLARDFETEG